MRSLIDGVVGITEVQIGNLVSTTSVLTTVSQIQPIKAWFAISEREYLNIADRLQNVVLANGVRADGDGGTVVKTDDLAFELTLANGERYPFRGTFLFANRQIDSLTGTIRIATSFPNPWNWTTSNCDMYAETGTWTSDSSKRLSMMVRIRNRLLAAEYPRSASFINE